MVKASESIEISMQIGDISSCKLKCSEEGIIKRVVYPVYRYAHLFPSMQEEMVEKLNGIRKKEMEESKHVS